MRKGDITEIINSFNTESSFSTMGVNEQRETLDIDAMKKKSSLNE